MAIFYIPINICSKCILSEQNCGYKLGVENISCSMFIDKRIKYDICGLCTFYIPQESRDNKRFISGKCIIKEKPLYEDEKCTECEKFKVSESKLRFIDSDTIKLDEIKKVTKMIIEKYNLK